jgi:protein NrfC
MVEEEREEKGKKVSRRAFVIGTGAGAAGLVIGGAIKHETFAASPVVVEEAPETKEREVLAAPSAQEEIPESTMWLVVDHKKCAGCGTCMLACSLVHEGKSNLSLARIQIMGDSFGSFPTDIQMAVCRQCDDPKCYEACPIKGTALVIDPTTGVRYIDEEQCIGCKACIPACHFSPSRISWDQGRKVALKCDMCRTTPYWDSQGKQACVEACPMKAIKFTTEKPIGEGGYEVNLRGDGWAQLGLPTD